MPIDDDTIEDAAGKPKSITSHDGRQVVQHSPKELVEAQQLLDDRAAADAAASVGGSGLRLRKIVPHYP